MAQDVRWFGLEVELKTASLVRGGVRAMMDATVREIKRRIRRPGPQHSEPGEPPRKQTGDLFRSWQVDVTVTGRGTIRGRLTSDVRYQEYLERGTRFMAPRPHMLPAWNIVLSRWEQFFPKRL